MKLPPPIYEDFPCFIAWHLPKEWHIEIWLGRDGFSNFTVWMSKANDRFGDTKVAVEDMPGGDDLDISGQILAAINHAREQEGLEPVTWEDCDRDRA